MLPGMNHDTLGRKQSFSLCVVSRSHPSRDSGHAMADEAWGARAQFLAIST